MTESELKSEFVSNFGIDYGMEALGKKVAKMPNFWKVYEKPVFVKCHNDDFLHFNAKALLSNRFLYRTKEGRTRMTKLPNF